MRLNFEIEGEKQLSRRLRILNTKLDDFSGSFKQIGQDLTKLFGGEVFTTEGAAIGESWAPGPYYSGLVRTGRMRGAFTYRSGRDFVAVGNPTPYFKYHQSNQPRQVLPRRVMMKLDDKRRQNIVRTFQREIIESANQSALRA